MRMPNFIKSFSVSRWTTTWGTFSLHLLEALWLSSASSSGFGRTSPSDKHQGEASVGSTVGNALSVGGGDPIHMMGEQGALGRGEDKDTMAEVTDVEGVTFDRLGIESCRVDLKA